MSDDDFGNYRSALKDAIGRPIPNEGDLRVWLDDNLVDRRAQDGWVHVRTVREACFLLWTGRVVELSLDDDLDDREVGDDEIGFGFQVIDFLEEQDLVHDRSLWPRDGITLRGGGSEESRTLVDDDLSGNRLALKDAIGRPIPNEGELRVWLDDDLINRRAWEGWGHVRTVREACFLVWTGRVIELSLDNDLNNGEHVDNEFGLGFEVIDFLEDQYFTHGRPLWPRDGFTPHTANPSGRRRMEQAVDALVRRDSLAVESERRTDGMRQHFVTGA